MDPLYKVDTQEKTLMAEGMATTKRFILFAEYFKKCGHTVTVVLKQRLPGDQKLESGEYNGMKYFIFIACYKSLVQDYFFHHSLPSSE